jgi:hypothetical protein
MALCGALRMGVESIEPKMPPLVMVKTPPSRSARVILPSRAFLAASPMAFSMSAMPSLSQFADDRDHQALLGGDGDADVVVVVLDNGVAVDAGR